MMDFVSGLKLACKRGDRGDLRYYIQSSFLLSVVVRSKMLPEPVFAQPVGGSASVVYSP